MTEPHEQSFASMERQLILEAIPERDQLQLVLASAWAILSAAFSEENHATIDYLDSNTPFEIVHVSLHLATDRLLKDAQRELHQSIHRDLNGNNVASSMGPRETSRKRRGLPNTIIASEMNDGCRFLKDDFVLAISCRACTSNDRSITLRGCYNCTRLEKPDCHDLLDRIGNLVTQLGTGGKKSLGDFDLMCTSDKEQLGAWNEFMPPLLKACVQDLIELQSKRYPGNEAVCAWDGSFTYEELDRRATVLAEKLVSQGVGLGCYVPLMFEKSKWHIVSLLAVRKKPSIYPIWEPSLIERELQVLKAGAAFVALEHSLPDGRIRIILEQLGSLRLILTSRTQSKRIERLTDHVIVVDELTTSGIRSGIPLPVSGTKTGLQPDHPAYVIFTSGSTGR